MFHHVSRRIFIRNLTNLKYISITRRPELLYFFNVERVSENLIPLNIFYSYAQITKKKRLKSRKERNKSATQRNRCPIPHKTSQSETPVSDKVVTKPVKKTCGSKKNQGNKLSYTVRSKKETPATNTSSPVRIGKIKTTKLPKLGALEH